GPSAPRGARGRTSGRDGAAASPGAGSYFGSIGGGSASSRLTAAGVGCSTCGASVVAGGASVAVGGAAVAVGLGAARAVSSSRERSASTSSSIVRLKSLEALRNSASILPTLLPISGSRRGPNTMRATTRMRKISGPPSVPNIRTRCYHAPPAVLHSAVSTPIRQAVLAAAIAAAAAGAGAEIPVVELEGAIHPVSAGYVVTALDRAEAAGAPLVVIRIDTPGGLDTSMRQIVDRVLRSRMPVAVWVGPSGARAASAGFVITIIADVAAMAPGTNIGAAHPVSGLGSVDETMAKKMASDAAAYVRGKAERRGRNVELAEKAVLESRSFTEREALEGKLIDLIAPDVPALLRALDGKEVKRFDGSAVTLHLQGEATRTVAMNWRQRVL